MKLDTGMNDRFAYRAYQMMHPATKADRITRSRAIAQILSGGGIGLALSTWVCFRLGSDLTVVALVYLIEIVLLSLLDSLVASAIFSVMALGCLNYFFTQPLFSFRVDLLNDVVALIAFLTASLIVTSLVHRVRRLSEVHRKQAQLLDLTHDSVMVRDMEDVVTYWNNGAQALYGWKKEEVLGKVAQSVLCTRFPVALGDIKESLFATGRWEGELINTRRDGLQAAVATRWALLRDDRGRPIATLETSTDITERKRKEEALQHVARLTTVGELGASLAHELAQPLCAISLDTSASLRWLDRDTPNLEEALPALRRVVCESQRLTELFSRVRMLARRTPPQMTRLEMNEVVNDVIPLVQREVLNQRVTLKTKLATGLPAVLGDRIQLAQVMTNLIMNGIQAMDRVEDRVRELLIELRRSDESSVIVAVQDSGKGIDAENASKLFEPFFTTKPEGMGVGLSICHSIVRAHGGELRAMNNAGYGATFEFSLPSITANAPEE
ncbi:ATP-binding protein [Paraburkholderia sp. DGU8]|uniref:ATP-binding protein n=1 Tax=Paraburkholderia sp. DGU8 TaxID=3161997 RepID=UPI0034660C4C